MTARTTRTRAAFRQIALHVVLAIAGILVLLPFLVMLRTALTPDDSIFRGTLGLHGLTVRHFLDAWNRAPWAHYYRNGLLAVAGIYIGQILTCLPAGYALARLRFRGSGTATWVILACLAMPTQIIALPVFLMISRVGWLDTLPALIVPFVTSAFGIFVFRQFILTIPQSLFDAARLDGVGPFGVVWRVVLPNVRPALAAFGVLSVMGHWNDLFWPSVVLRTQRAATVPYGIVDFASGEGGTDYGTQMAAAAIAAIPLVIALCFVQRQFVQGLAPSATAD
ncbi:carbohydrate ABC transporter permease [Amycolatopsis sp. GM8]|uniref:carbohydrate ABC transporter permease n=1 Tax=Amycolatopsis sp. GM8 TaxID=2896530 RepID=UPI001F47A003|nr:carbohydrate ABC transporter permease [Amycolatopsis sp. GM8]